MRKKNAQWTLPNAARIPYTSGEPHSGRAALAKQWQSQRPQTLEEIQEEYGIAISFSENAHDVCRANVAAAGLANVDARNSTG